MTEVQTALEGLAAPAGLVVGAGIALWIIFKGVRVAKKAGSAAV